MISPLVYCMKMKSTCSSLFPPSFLSTLLYIKNQNHSFLHIHRREKKKNQITSTLTTNLSTFFLILRNSHTYKTHKNPDPRFNHRTYTWTSIHRLWSILLQISLSVLLVCELKKIQRYGSIEFLIKKIVSISSSCIISEKHFFFLFYSEKHLLVVIHVLGFLKF